MSAKDRSNDLGAKEGKPGNSSGMSADVHEENDAGEVKVDHVDDDDDTEEQEGLPTTNMHSPHCSLSPRGVGVPAASEVQLRLPHILSLVDRKQVVFRLLASTVHVCRIDRAQL